MFGRVVFAVFSFAFGLTSGDSEAQECYRSSISSPTPFMGNNDEIFRLVDGTRWQVQFEYEYLYEYYPTVTICPNRGVLIVGDKSLNVAQINSRDIVESKIDGEFQGWEGETVFQLANGQIWQQADFAFAYHYSYSPDVLIVRLNGQFFMQVEGVRDRIRVVRLR